MKILRISQQADREQWLEFRRGKITGTAKVRPLTRGEDRTPQGFWKVLAGKLAVDSNTGETPMQRGQRCENEALAWVAETKGVELDLDPGVWVSDKSSDIILSPDGAEPSETPRYAAEAKNFDSENHLKYIYQDIVSKRKPDYNPLFSVPKEYQDQVLSYFSVNEHLEVVYFVLADDRVIYPELEHYLIEIKREDVGYLIEELQEVQERVLENVENVINELLKEMKK